MGPTDALTWLVATAAGSILAPEGTNRTLRADDMRYVRGVLLTPAQRRQLRNLEGIARSTEADRVTRWIRAGFAHRCTPREEITLIVQRAWLPGDACPWSACPEPSDNSSGTSGHDVRNLRTTRPEPPDIVPNETPRSAAVSGSSESAPQGVLRGDTGSQAPTLAEEQDQEAEALDRVKEALGAVEVRT
jgi:hypothetical protein